MSKITVFQSVAVIWSAFLFTGCVSGNLHESNARYACYVNEFDTKPLSAPGDDYTYRGVKRLNSSNDYEYCIEGVFSDTNRFLRVTIPKTATGMTIKSCKCSGEVYAFCVSYTNQHASMDVTTSCNDGERSIIRFRKWSRLSDLLHPEPQCDGIPRGIIVYFDVSSERSAVLFRHESDGEYVILPVTTNLEWILRSRKSMFLRRSAYIFTVSLDVVTLPLQALYALIHLGDC